MFGEGLEGTFMQDRTLEGTNQAAPPSRGGDLGSKRPEAAGDRVKGGELAARRW